MIFRLFSMKQNNEKLLIFGFFLFEMPEINKYELTISQVKQIPNGKIDCNCLLINIIIC